MPVSSDDDYLSIDQYPIAPSMEAKANTHGKHRGSAGRTPLPLNRMFNVLKCGGNSVNRKFTSARNKVSSIDMSNFLSPNKKERVISASRKQRCLFNTMHVKTAMALLTVFYLFGLAVLDNHLFWQRMSYSESMFLSILSIVIIAVIIIAQLGLKFEKYMLLFPFFIVQFFFLGAIYIGYSRGIAEQFLYAKANPHLIMRLILIMLYEAIVMIMHTYALLITVRCIVYFKNKKRRTVERLCFNNRCFLDGVPNAKNLKDRIVNLRIDVTTDEEDAQSMNVALDSATRPTFSNTFGSGNVTSNSNLPAVSKNVNPTVPNPLNVTVKAPNVRAELVETPKSAMRLFGGVTRFGGATRASSSGCIGSCGNILNDTVGIPSSSLASTQTISNSAPQPISRQPTENVSIPAIAATNCGANTTAANGDNANERPSILTAKQTMSEGAAAIDVTINNSKRSVTFAGTTFHDISPMCE